MGELQRMKKGGGAVAAKADANPEGKGLNGFLLDWHQSTPRGVVAKSRHQVLAEYFTSMLVLSAGFGYKPAVGTPNYLYLVDGKWSLSLIAPDEWSDERRAAYVGRCVLQRDMTWTIAPSERIAKNDDVADTLARFYDAFTESFDTDEPLEEILPFYAGKLRYYQRLYASALSRSLRATVTLGDQAMIRGRDWQRKLPKLEELLLVRSDT